MATTETPPTPAERLEARLFDLETSVERLGRQMRRGFHLIEARIEGVKETPPESGFGQWLDRMISKNRRYQAARRDRRSSMGGRG